MSYFSELKAAMKAIAAHPDVIFVGQGVGVAGTSMSPTLDGINPKKRLEFPVAEDMQMGFCTGLSLQGYIPVCIFPRWNFLLCAANQIVNHLDRMPLYSLYNPKVIIRVATPSTEPFNPGPQHDADFGNAFRLMLRDIRIVELAHEDMIVPAYLDALGRGKSTILVEYTDAYRDQRASS
jgi:pyruvate/2-oxoglutarate/acetoin dehydrogenase E1 component